MAAVHDPRALEGYIGLQAENAAAAVQQIRLGQHPQYDDNCRRDVGECLVALADARERQLELDPTYPVGFPVKVAGLREYYLPADMTLGDLRRVRQFVVVPA